MSATLAASCPSCKKEFQVPTQFVGKLIKCKNCQTMFEVMDPNAPKPAPRPAAAKPAVAAKPAAKPATAAKPAAKPAAPAAPAQPGNTFQLKDEPLPEPPAPMPFSFKTEAPPPPPPPPTKSPFADDDDDANPYGVNKTADEDVARCPSCAKELDPPDSVICLNCGFNMQDRRRHEVKAVYETTPADIFMHLLPGIVCVFVILFVLTFAILTSLNMRGWLEGSFLESDEKDEATLKKKFYLSPFCFNIWIWIMSIWIIYKCGRFAIKRLILNPKPTEVAKAFEKD